MAQTRYTVKKGDTLSGIAADRATTISKLLGLNPDIQDPDLIYVGQSIVVSGDADTKTKNVSLKGAKIMAFGLVSKYDDGTIFATWAWDEGNTDHYEVEWKYSTGVGVTFIGNQSSVKNKQSIYSGYPDTATRISFRVKPVAKTLKDSKGKDYTPWTAQWSTSKTFYLRAAPPDRPSTPTVEIDGYKLTAKLNYTDSRGYGVQFKIIKGNSTTFVIGDSKIKTNYASYSCTIDPGSEYKVCCRVYSTSKVYSEWSEYSTNTQSPPAAPKGIYQLFAFSATAVKLDWDDVKNATGYEVQYTTVRRYFDSNPSGVSSVDVNANTATSSGTSRVSHAEITGLTAGNEYFFRVRATNEKGKSPWTADKSIFIGEAPSSPTTWSSTSTAVAGDPLTLYWVHNSADGSRQTAAEIEIDVGGTVTTHKITYGTSISSSNTEHKLAKLDGFVLKTGVVVKIVMTFANTITSPTLNVNSTGRVAVEAVNADTCYWPANSLVTFTYDGSKWKMNGYDTEEGTTSYSVDTSKYIDGTAVKWRVRTAGFLTDASGIIIFSDWSTQRSIDIYANPTLMLTVTKPDGVYLGTEIETDASGNIITSPLTSFPFNVSALSGPNSQNPVGYHLSIVAAETYDTVGNTGNEKTVNEGEEVYSKYFDVSSNPLTVELSANDVDLSNNITYTLTCVVSMDSGLTKGTSLDFLVAWADEDVAINAEIGYDKDTCTAYIGPYCKDEDGNLVSGVSLSVYRRDYDGGFTELVSGMNNLDSTYITDPHPSLDYARYRVVTKRSDTGVVSYYDVPSIPVGEVSAIIQWDEEWTNPDTITGDPLDQPVWSGTMLKIPYNIDVSDKHDPDKELIEYIGRKYPVTYYGTQVGHSSTWSMSVPKSDRDTLYLLRRLASWMGDVYVREPSGSGYWANITVSFSQKHQSVVIPVTMNIVRVEGGK